MSGASPPPWAVSQKAAETLIAAGAGQPAPGWIEVALVTAGALVLAFVAFVAAARGRA